MRHALRSGPGVPSYIDSWPKIYAVAQELQETLALQIGCGRVLSFGPRREDDLIGRLLWIPGPPGEQEAEKVRGGPLSPSRCRRSVKLQ
ncbi:hypothetical protein NDU88_009834 [Pleurodeles waltl]|uniref:Uncharacterized protein n=1 Tax=Pleurodeles waltl TaxID=8319 RepID=A0AAV7RXQ8_PLEWA|nr:hypothetical protein NDU88_009834 [Pleurodeles waltl]